MTDDEMKSVVDAAHGLGMKVAAHIYPATRSGMPSWRGWIRWSMAPSPTPRLSADEADGTYLVPDPHVFDVYYQAALHHPELLPPGTAEKELANDQMPIKNFPNA